MPSTSVPSPTSHLAREMKTGLIRCCGENRIAYDVAVLDLFAKRNAETAVQFAARRQAKAKAGSRPEPAVPAEVPALPLGLTDEQVVLLELVAEGLIDAQVARRLGLSRNQVTRSLRRLYAALGVEFRVAAVAAGYEFGLLGPAARRARAGRPPS